jgi:hypothetical protein
MIPTVDEMLSWILHPDTYQMTWWVLLTICWFGFTIERRLKLIQRDIAILAAKGGSCEIVPSGGGSSVETVTTAAQKPVGESAFRSAKSAA